MVLQKVFCWCIGIGYGGVKAVIRQDTVRFPKKGNGCGVVLKEGGCTQGVGEKTAAASPVGIPKILYENFYSDAPI